jgi:hypothetical protein
VALGLLGDRKTAKARFEQVVETDTCGLACLSELQEQTRSLATILGDIEVFENDVHQRVGDVRSGLRLPIWYGHILS